MIRAFAIRLSTAACLITGGFALLWKYVHAGPKFTAGLGLFMLFAALILMLVAYGQFSFKLKAWKALALGLGTMGTSSVVMRLIGESVSAHSWTFSLLALPMILLLSGGAAVMIGTFRLLKKYVAVQYE